MYLSEGYKNRMYRIEKIETDVYTCNVLMKWQIKRGSVVYIVRKHPIFPYIISINHSYIALDNRLAGKIKVIPYA